LKIIANAQGPFLPRNRVSNCHVNACFTITPEHKTRYIVRGKRFTVCTEISIILGTVRFTIRGGFLRCKRYDAHFLKKSRVELPFSSFGDLFLGKNGP
jgi:hypothetical protein